MRRPAPRSIGRWFLILPLLLLNPSAHADDAAEAPPAPPPCTAPEFSGLDFWLGDWDVSWEGGSGSQTVTREYGGCVIREDFRTEAFNGTSVSVWVPSQGVWKQTWVDDSGGYLDFTGGPEGDGRFVLSREAPERENVTHQRMVFHDITPDSLVWDWESSSDGGESWDLRWQIRYRRRS